MSRFRPRMSSAGAVLAPPPVPTAKAAPPKGIEARHVIPSEPANQLSEGPLQQLGFFVLCAYLVSGILNEWAVRFAGSKAYVSTVTLFALPLAWLIAGRIFRGLRHPIGLLWLGFLVWLLVDTPFSVWRGGTVQLLVNYLPRSYMLFFFVVSLAVSFRDCRRLMYVGVVVSTMVLITCTIWGRTSDDGRYYVPGGAGFFGNSNEL